MEWTRTGGNWPAGERWECADATSTMEQEWMPQAFFFVFISPLLTVIRKDGGFGGVGGQAACMWMLHPFDAAGLALMCCFAPAVLIIILLGGRRPGGLSMVLI